jgi:hypothetical protein
VIVLSEYGITPVSGAVHPNRVLRKAGFIRVRMERGLEKLDAGASEAFAVADHQVAHVYVKRKDRVSEVAELFDGVPGIDAVLDEECKRRLGLDHARAGDLVLVSAPDRWFTYYYWLEDGLAPEFARTVDIHRKPGYDPVELFLDPSITVPALTIGWKLARKSLGFRTLMDVIPLDATLVRGSHGRPGAGPDGPLVMSKQTSLIPAGKIVSTDVFAILLEHLGGQHGS